MILPDTKKVVIINAGHWDNPDTSYIEDSGATRNHIIEQVEVAKIRDILVGILETYDYTVYSVPDHLNLSDSIKWANERAPELNDGLAVDIHLNYSVKPSPRGSEAFFGDTDISRKVAAALSKGISESMGIPNRGAKPDTASAVRRLAWIRETTMWASLVEVCFLSNNADMEVLHSEGGYRMAAQGIADGINEIFGVEKEDDCTLKKFNNSELILELLRRYRYTV